MKKTLLILILFFGNFALWSQTKYDVELAVGKTKELSLQLIGDIDGKNLLSLPVALQLTDKGYIVMMFGNGEPLQDEQSVWLFSSPKNLKILMANNKNISATKEFQSRYSTLDPFFKVSTDNMKYIRDYEFDTGYETIRRNPKPAFFQIDKNAKEIVLYLTFYVSKPDKKFPDLLFTRAKIMELKIKIK